MRSTRCRRPDRAHRRDDRGSALIEFIWLGLILLVPVVYLLLAVFSVQSASYGVSAASRAAGRAFVLAPDQPTAYARAQQAAAVALSDQGVDAGAVDLRVSCRPDPQRCLSPGSTITVVVGTARALPLVPDLLGGARPSVRVDSTHTEPYGTFREDRS